jgi:hypothetical protein
MLAVPGKVLFESKLDGPLSDPWKSAKGAWDNVGGVLRGSEKPEDKHGAVTRWTSKLPDCVIEYEVKFEGGKVTSLSINGVKDHMARILMTPQFVTIQKDDSDHAGPDKAVVFARVSADLKPGVWHKVRMEMIGDTMLGKVDDIVAWGSDPLFKQERMSPGFTVAGQSVDFRNLKISEATLNPKWSEVQATLPKPGEKVEAPAPNPAAAKAPKAASPKAAN